MAPGLTVCFGEIMLRLTPPGCLRIGQARSYEAWFAGSEGNVAVALAAWGVPSSMVTKVPDNPVGEALVAELRRSKVDVTHVHKGGPRLGVFFVEKAASQRAPRVVYDRAHSSLAEASAAEFDWEAILANACWLHLSGITPALSPAMEETVAQACRAAKLRQATISMDINYRRALWTPERAGRSLTGLLPMVDVTITNREHASLLFGIGGSDGGPAETVRGLQARFGCRTVAITTRQGESASQTQFGALLHQGDEYVSSRTHCIEVIDQVGSGDAFTAGIIYGLQNELSPQETVEYAAAAACLKHTIPGDFCECSAAEVRMHALGEGSGRLVR